MCEIHFRASDVVCARVMTGSDINIGLCDDWPDVIVRDYVVHGELGIVAIPASERVLVCGSIRGRCDQFNSCGRSFVFDRDARALSV